MNLRHVAVAIANQTGENPGELRLSRILADEDAIIVVSANVLGGARGCNVWKAQLCNLNHIHISRA